MVPLTQSIFAGGIVNLSIGPSEVPFDAHIELLCALSAFFDKALDGRFIEAETKHIRLPDEDPKTFAEFLSWAYTGQFTFGEGPGGVGWMELCALWVVGDKYQVPNLQNHIITLLGRKYNHPITGKGNIHPLVVTFVYDNTVDTSPLRRAITDIAVWGMDIEKLSQHRSAYPKEFLEDYALQQARKAKGLLRMIQLPVTASPEKYFVKTVEPPQEKAREKLKPEKFEKQWQRQREADAEMEREFSASVDEKKGDLGDQTSVRFRVFRVKKIPRGVRAASGSIVWRSSIGAGASNPSPARTPGTPTSTSLFGTFGNVPSPSPPRALGTSSSASGRLVLRRLG